MKKKIAIIGSGIAGLTSGWLCREAGAEVTILEAHANRGMDSLTEVLNVEGGDSGHVDVPLRVMSPHAWPTVLKLCEKLGVKTFEVDTQVACSWINSRTWFRSSKIQIGSKIYPWAPLNYLLRPETYRILLGFIRLLKSDPPARQILNLLQKIVYGARLRRFQGGTKALAEKLGEGLNWQNGIRVEKLMEKSTGIFLHSQKMRFGPFDYVICAVQANQLNFLPEQYSSESKLLNSFPYDSGTLWVHRDIRFMPERKQDWSPLHYQMNKDLSQSMFSVWVNPIEPTISNHEPVLQTWNPIFEPKPERVIVSVPMERAVVNQSNHYLLEELDLLHKLPSRKVFFCGSYAAPGVPLLESAVHSAINVVCHLGFDSSISEQFKSPNKGSFEMDSNYLAA